MANNLTLIECAKCVIEFGITEKYDSKRRSDHNTFFCPNGHGNVYTAREEDEDGEDEGEDSEDDEEGDSAVGPKYGGFKPQDIKIK